MRKKTLKKITKTKNKTKTRTKTTTKKLKRTKKTFNINFSDKKISKQNKTFFNSFLSIFGIGYDTNETIIKYRNELLNKYKNILIKKNNSYYLPKGIKLYHGSLEDTFVEHNNISFFGLDNNISLWYILELDIIQYAFHKIKENKKLRNLKNLLKYSQNYTPKYNGYLYTFTTKEDIKIKIIKNIINNPKESISCLQKKNVCFHPQFSYRGLPFIKSKTPKIYGLSIEISLFYPIYKNKLQLLKKEKVNINKLYKNREYKNYKPQTAILKSSIKHY